MSKSKIHFRNEPFLARVVGKGNTPVMCTPVVCDEIYRCGIGVFYEKDDHGHVWGLAAPRNLIAAWRGTEVLRRLHTLEDGTICAAYHTGIRNPHASDVDLYVKSTIKKIGQKTYEAILATPVPEQIVRAILDNQKDEFAPDLSPITDEVRAGTIQWRQEFADAGIKHPDEVDTKKQAQKATIVKFERLLASYARSSGLKRECHGMWNVEATLLTLVDKGADLIYPDTVLVALAGVVGELVISEFAMALLPGCHPISRQAYNTRIEKTKERALDHSTLWLVSDPGHAFWKFWKRPQSPFMPESAKALLRRLLEEYFPSKPEATPT